MLHFKLPTTIKIRVFSHIPLGHMSGISTKVLKILIRHQKLPLFFSFFPPSNISSPSPSPSPPLSSPSLSISPKSSLPIDQTKLNTPDNGTASISQYLVILHLQECYCHPNQKTAQQAIAILPCNTCQFSYIDEISI